MPTSRALFVLSLLASSACASSSATMTTPPQPQMDPVAVPESPDRAASTPADEPTAPSTPTEPVPPLTEAPDAWQVLDLDEDGVPGVSANRAYRELLAGRQPQRTVVVAVIDGGIDTTHIDLQASLWRNPGETAGNGLDDDGNGYVDDVFGWNFVGGADGRSVDDETLEVTRLYVACQQGVEPQEGPGCDAVESAYQAERTETSETLAQIDQISAAYDFAVPVLQNATGADELTPEKVAEVRSLAQDVRQAQQIYMQLDGAGLSPEIIDEAREAYQGLMDYGLNPDFDAREIVGDDLANGMERLYGNRDVMGPDASHGTHVAGIIGAVRGNGEGIDGIGPNVQLMTLRAVPNGDERDKDIANAIRYAVDHGAHIINMSFGKSHSPRKSLVDAAVRYADEAGVLMVHAAGNDGENLDDGSNFPNPEYSDGGRATNWIEVGASNWMVDSLAATFSNYSGSRVDIFAPGVDVLSTYTGDEEYRREDGTSMASPVVSGVAALLMAYFPDLTATDVRRILLESAVPYGEHQVARPGLEEIVVPFGTLSVTGGVVNAYEAVRMALERMQ